jgi:hypothetical protein
MSSQSARLSIILCLVVLLSLASHSQAVDAVLDLSGKKISLGTPLRAVSSTATRLPASRVYDFEAQGSVRGTGELASIVPPGTTLADLATRFGGSIPLSGRVQNNTGRLPFAFINRSMSRVYPIAVPVLGTIDVRITLKASVAVQRNGTIAASFVADAKPLINLPFFDLGSLPMPSGSIVFEAGSQISARTIFDAYAGDSAGLLDNAILGAAPKGLANVKVGLGGLITGSLHFDGRKFAINTGIDATLSTPVIRLGRTGATVRFTTSEANPDQITVTVEDAQGTVLVTATLDRASLPGGLPTPRAGNYTIALSPPALPAGETAATHPVGHGYLTATVTAAGGVLLAGQLCDGTPIATASLLLADETFPFYAPIAKGQGALVGTVAMQPAENPADLDGTLRWLKPATPKARLFKNAFDLDLTAEGSRYLKPLRGQPVLPMTAGEIIFEGGNLATPLSSPVSLSPRNVFTVSAPVSAKVRAVTSKGLLRGIFKAAPNVRAVPLRGVFLQKQNGAAGFFIGSGATPDSGSVTISVPAPAP